MNFIFNLRKGNNTLYLWTSLDYYWMSFATEVYVGIKCCHYMILCVIIHFINVTRKSWKFRKISCLMNYFILYMYVMIVIMLNDFFVLNKILVWKPHTVCHRLFPTLQEFYVLNFTYFILYINFDLDYVIEWNI